MLASAAFFLLTFAESPHTPKGPAWYLSRAAPFSRSDFSDWRGLNDSKRVHATIEARMNFSFLRDNRDKIFIGLLEFHNDSFERLASVSVQHALPKSMSVYNTMYHMCITSSRTALSARACSVCATSLRIAALSCTHALVQITVYSLGLSKGLSKDMPGTLVAALARCFTLWVYSGPGPGTPLFICLGGCGWLRVAAGPRHKYPT